MEIILIVILVILLAVLALLIWLTLRGRGSVGDLAPLSGKIDALLGQQERTDRSVREEIAQFRAEMKTGAHQERAELTVSLKSFSDSASQWRQMLCDYILKKSYIGRCLCQSILKRLFWIDWGCIK